MTVIINMEEWMLRNEELSFLSKSVSFWDKLSHNEKQLIQNNSTLINYEKGQNIHSPESECLGMIFITKGELRVYILSEDGREVTLYRLYEGDSCILSASCILHTITFDVFIDAQVSTQAIIINIGTVSKLIESNIYVENFALKNTSERFSDVMYAIEQILFMSFDKRLATFLLDEISKTKKDELKFTHDQIAKYLGSAREVVSRMLKSFESKNILIVNRGSIKIIDKEKLQKLIT